MTHSGITIGNTFIDAGQRATIELPAASLYSHAPMAIPVHTVCGKQSGPSLFISAAIHGDEITGVEIIRRLLKLPLLRQLRGTLLAVPIVNVYGFINRSRYLPDRRDLNRSFPGSEGGSMTARMADLFTKEILRHCQYGVDIHSGAVHRDNLPHIRVNLEDPKTEALARVFDVPLILNSDPRDGSLREYAGKKGIPVLLYEAGEALRFNERAIRAGLKGILSVMRKLDMLPAGRWHEKRFHPVIARSSTWIRASESGILMATTRLGARVEKGSVVGIITDPFGEHEYELKSHASGIVIGRMTLPLVNEGEALFHVATFESNAKAEQAVEAFQSPPLPLEPMVDMLPPEG
jgi:predicted deacylase